MLVLISVVDCPLRGWLHAGVSHPSPLGIESGTGCPPGAGDGSHVAAGTAANVGHRAAAAAIDFGIEAGAGAGAGPGKWEDASWDSCRTWPG